MEEFKIYSVSDRYISALPYKEIEELCKQYQVNG